MNRQENQLEGANPPETHGVGVWQASVVVLCFAVLLSSLLRTFADPDLWGHVRFGMDMLQQRSLIFVDPYSYLTQGRIWINHEWLAEIFMAGAWLAANSAGLIALRIVLIGLTLTVIFVHLTRMLRLPYLPSFAVLVLAVPGLVTSINVVRPQLFTFLFYALTLLVIYRAEVRRYRWLWTMPFVAAIWVNTHGGVLAGCGILGMWAVLHLLRHPDAWRAVIPPLLTTAAALLINPYGINLIVFLLQTATVARPEITDWQPLNIVSWYGASYLALLLVSWVAIARSRRQRRQNLLLVFALTAIMPLLAIRHLPLMAITFAMFVGEHVVDLWEQWRGGKARSSTPHRWVAVIPLALALVIPLVAVTVDRGQIIVNDAIRYPNAALTLLKTGAFQGNLATFFDWGEYIIWHAGPGIQVSSDGRRETVYSDEIRQKNLNLWLGAGRWDALLTDYPTDAVLVNRASAADNLLRLSTGWLRVYEDDASVLYINKAFPNAPAIQRAAAEFSPPPRPLYFP